MKKGMKIITGNNAIMHGKLRQVRGAFKEKWARIVNDERGLLDAKIDQAIGLLQENYGYTVDKAWQVFHGYVVDRDGMGEELIQQVARRLEDLPGIPKRKKRRGLSVWLWLVIGLGTAIAAIRLKGVVRSYAAKSNSTDDWASISKETK